MGRRLLSIGVCLAVWVSLLVPTAASAHQSIRLGKYTCWEYALDGTLWPAGYDLKIKSSNTYAFVSGATLIGRGRFAHVGEEVRFRSGYLHRRNWEAFHGVDGSRAHGIRMVRETRNGFTVYYCSNPR